MPATNKGFPYPAGATSNNVPADLQAIADMLELWPGIPSLTQAQVDALSAGAKTTNLVVYNSTTSKLQKWTGSAWNQIVFTDDTRLHTITLSTSDPSGGADGDIWVKYIP